MEGESTPGPAPKARDRVPDATGGGRGGTERGGGGQGSHKPHVSVCVCIYGDLWIVMLLLHDASDSSNHTHHIYREIWLLLPPAGNA